MAKIRYSVADILHFTTRCNIKNSDLETNLFKIAIKKNTIKGPFTQNKFYIRGKKTKLFMTCQGHRQ